MSSWWLNSTKSNEVQILSDVKLVLASLAIILKEFYMSKNIGVQHVHQQNDKFHEVIFSGFVKMLSDFFLFNMWAIFF